VVHPQSYRAILGLHDLVRAVGTIIQDKSLIKQNFEIFNLNSFNCNIEAIAVEIASAVGVPLIVANVTSTSQGFSLDSSKMENMFHFHFHESAESMVRVLLDNFPRSVMAQGVHGSTLDVASSSHNVATVPCQVCGSHHLQQVLDLHHQPLANSFMPSSEEAYMQERYPLRLMRCPVCNHVQLSHIVDRKKLFQNYLYQSNTSSTLLQYFDWLADKIIGESSVEAPQGGTVIEIASNDGSQLDYFRSRGWNTIGVDPAQNLIPFARSKGHTVIEGFWGSESLDVSQLPPPTEVDAIVAQNVLAHVESPVEFLKACAKAMGPKTKLYIQTSQCEMIFEGQFDTAYHEHISFFSAHSFEKAAQLAGLHMSKFEETPVHGISCFVTFELPSETKTIEQPGVSVVKRLEAEVAVGINTEVFYKRFEEKARQLELWIVKHLSLFSSSGHIIGGYGAAAKGIVMLHFIQKFELFSFIVDDAPLKNGLYCPGTNVPVWNTTQLASLRESETPLVLVIFAWNFWSEISKKIQGIFQGSGKSIICIVPFPVPTIVKLEISSSNSVSAQSNVLASLPKNSFSIIPPKFHPKIVLIMHFYNAEALLPYWIRNHAPFFDEAILVDYHSTDDSVSVIRRIAPSSWRVVASANEQQDVTNNTLVNEELQWYAKLNPDAWIVTLDVSEFLVTTSLRDAIIAKQQNDAQTDEHINTLQIPKLYAFNQEGIVLGSDDSSLLLKHSSVGFVSSNNQSADENLNVPNSISHLVSSLCESTVRSGLSYRSININQGTSLSNSYSNSYCGDNTTSNSHMGANVVHDVFIIDYVWQRFDLEDGNKYCPLAHKLTLESATRAASGVDACSYYPGHFLDKIDLSDILHGHQHQSEEDRMKPFVRVFQDVSFTFRSEEA
jgi:2-polyprenyl-3-methyl-5-hydroxy-6-metoxy-1,4-benzoquinol methylase